MTFEFQIAFAMEEGAFSNFDEVTLLSFRAFFGWGLALSVVCSLELVRHRCM